MNFLQIVQRTRRKCRATGTGPVALTNQNEETNRIIDFVNEAWMDIQGGREDWQWMRAPATVQTVLGQAIYTPADFGLTDWGNWTRDTWRNYNTAAGIQSEIFMDYLDYEAWRDYYQFGATRFTRTQPIQVTITPDKSIGLGPVPLAGYTVTGDYYRVPTELVAATDIPSLPIQFHMAIVYRAMMFYGTGEAAPEVYTSGQQEFDRMMIRLNLNEMRQILQAPALA